MLFQLQTHYVDAIMHIYLIFASILVYTHVSTRKYESPSEVLPQNLDTHLRNVTY